MKNLIIAAGLLLSLSLDTNAQITVEGVTMPANLSAKSEQLVLNGAGLREKLFFDLYVGGLYLKSKSTDAKSIIEKDEAMAIKIEIISTLISSEKMIEAIDEGMTKSTKGNTTPLAKEIAQFKDAFKEEIVEGDKYDIIYVPGEGVTVYKNSKKVQNIAGLAFKKAAFGIWLCDEPADEDLKEEMLKG